MTEPLPQFVEADSDKLQPEGNRPPNDCGVPLDMIEEYRVSLAHSNGVLQDAVFTLTTKIKGEWYQGMLITRRALTYFVGAMKKHNVSGLFDAGVELQEKEK